MKGRNAALEPARTRAEPAADTAAVRSAAYEPAAGARTDAERRVVAAVGARRDAGPFDASPRVVAQRQQLDRMFGPALQLRAGRGASGVVQRVAVVQRVIGAVSDGSAVTLRSDPGKRYTAHPEGNGTYQIREGSAVIETGVTADDDRYIPASHASVSPATASGVAPAFSASGQSLSRMPGAPTPGPLILSPTTTPVPAVSSVTPLLTTSSVGAPSADDGKRAALPRDTVTFTNVVSAPPMVDLALVKEIGEQTLDGAIEMSKRILHAYPPQAYCYICVGQSPAVVAAYLEAQGHKVYSVPLSSFRAGTKSSQGNRSPLDGDEERGLQEHMERFLPPPKELGERNILVIDFVMNGGGAIAAYNYIHRYYLGTKQVRPSDDAFFSEERLSPLWDWDDTRMGTLAIKLAMLCAATNEKQIEAETSLNLAGEEEVDEDIGPMHRLQDASDYSIFAAGSPAQNTFIGKLDSESLKGRSPYGKQDKSKRGTRAEVRSGYQAMVRLFGAYRSAATASPREEKKSHAPVQMPHAQPVLPEWLTRRTGKLVAAVARVQHALPSAILMAPSETAEVLEGMRPVLQALTRGLQEAGSVQAGRDVLATANTALGAARDQLHREHASDASLDDLAERISSLIAYIDRRG